MENSQCGLVACFGLVWGSSPGHPPPLAPLAPPLLSIASQRPKGQNPENPGFSRPLRIPGRRSTPFEEDRGQAPVAVFQLRPGRRAPERAINGVFIFPTTNPNRARHLGCLGSISRCSAALSDHLIYRLPPLGTWPSASGTSIYIGIRNSYRG